MVSIVVLGMLFSTLRLAIATRLDLHVAIVAFSPEAARKRRGQRREHEDQPNGRLGRNHACTHSLLHAERAGSALVVTRERVERMATLFARDRRHAPIQRIAVDAARAVVCVQIVAHASLHLVHADFA
jgi:hypothetical protein